MIVMRLVEAFPDKFWTQNAKLRPVCGREVKRRPKSCR